MYDIYSKQKCNDNINTELKWKLFDKNKKWQININIYIKYSIVRYNTENPCLKYVLLSSVFCNET